MLLASPKLGQIKKMINQLRLSRMTLVVLNEIQESVVSVKDQTRREDVHTVTNVEAVDTGLFIGCCKRKDTTASTCKIKISSDKLNDTSMLSSQKTRKD